MKILKRGFWAILIGLLILPGLGRAETVYVSDEFEITLRTGPGNDNKILAMLKSGSALEVLKKGEEWSMVAAPNGKEGWVLNRYLTASPPSALVLERVRKDYDGLAAKYKDLKQKFDQLDGQKKAGDADLSQSRRKVDELSTAYETLKKDSADFLSLKKRYEEVAAELQAEKTRSAKLDEDNQQMSRDHMIQWVLTGAGILLVGFFIGLFSSSRRRPRSSLY